MLALLGYLFFILVPCYLGAPANEQIFSLPNLTEPFRSNHYAGYLPISSEKQLFYWFVESENDPAKDPVVLWLNGGPGCASMEGLFIEMGPFRVRNNGQNVTRNPWTWNRISNILYLDAPAGVGYSYYNSTKKVFDDDIVAQDNFDALKLWFEKFPERKTNDFFIAGESYAGTYVPMLSAKISQSPDVFPQFKGMLVGNGCVDDKINFNTKIWYQYYHGLIDETSFQQTLQTCCNGSQDCDFFAISLQNSTCGDTVNDLGDTVFYSGFDPYFLYFSCYLNPLLPYPPHNEDIQLSQLKRHKMRKYHPNKFVDYTIPMEAIEGQPDCASHNDHIPYLNTKEVRSILRIPDYVQAYAICSYEIEMNYVSQYANMADFFNIVLNANKRVALFNGDADTLCNVVENAQFLKNLNRTLKTPATAWHDPVQLPLAVGLWTEYDGISLITIKGGGHFPSATEQKPKETFQMFQNYIKNQNYSTPVTFDIAYNSTLFSTSTSMSTSTSGSHTTSLNGATTESYNQTTLSTSTSASPTTSKLGTIVTEPQHLDTTTKLGFRSLAILNILLIICGISL